MRIEKCVVCEFFQGRDHNDVDAVIREVEGVKEREEETSESTSSCQLCRKVCIWVYAGRQEVYAM